MTIAEGRVSIKVQVDGAKQALSDVQLFGKGAIGSLTTLGAQYLTLRTTALSVLNDLQPAYASLIASNEELRQSVLKTQTALASQFRIFDSGGKEIESVAEKITASEGTIREAILRLEKETRELSGVTTADTVEAFNIVVSEGGKFLNAQLGDYENSIDASIDITKGLVAALGSLNLPLQQARQEFRAFVQGDLKNPDAQLIKALGIDEASFAQAEREGRLAEFIRDSFEPAVEANKIASRSISGALSNIQDVSENAGRAAGEKLTDAFIDQLIRIQEALFAREADILAFADETGDVLEETFTGTVQTVEPLLKALIIALKPAFEGLFELLKFASEGIGNIGRAVEGLQQTSKDLALADRLRPVKPLVDALIVAFSPLTAVVLNLDKVADAVGRVQGQFARFNGNQADSRGALESYTNVLSATSQQIDLFTKKLAEADASGNTRQAEAYRKILRELGAELRTTADEVDNVRTFNKKDADSRQELIDKVEQQIGTLEDLGLASENITLDNKELQKFGDTTDELTRKLNGLITQIENGGGGDRNVFNQLQKDAAETITTLEKLGELNTEDAVAQLSNLASAAETAPEQRLALEKQITDVVKQGGAERLAQLEAEQAKTSALLATGAITANEAQLSGIDNRKARAQEELRQVQEQIQALNNTGGEDQRQIALLNSEAEKLNSTIEELEGNAAQLQLTQGIEQAEKDFTRANREISLALQERNRIIKSGTEQQFTTQAELSQRLIGEEAKANSEIIKLLESRIAEQQELLANAVGSQKSDLENSLADLQVELAGAKTQADQLSAELSGARLSQANQEAQLIRENLNQQAQQQQLANQNRINELKRVVDFSGDSEAEITRIQIEQGAQQARNAKASAEARIAALQSVPIPDNESARLELEAELRSAISERYNAELQLARQVQSELDFARQEQLRQLEKQRELIEDQIDDVQNLASLEQDRFNNQQRQNDLQIRSRQRLANLQKLQNDLQIGELTRQQEFAKLQLTRLSQGQRIANQLKSNANIGKEEAKVLKARLRELGLSGKSEEAIAKKKLQATRKQNQLEQQALQLRQTTERQALQLKISQEVVQARLAEAEAKQAINRQQLLLKELELERKKAELIEDPAERARTLNNIDERLGIQADSLSIARDTLAETEKQTSAIEKQGKAQQQLLNHQQAAAKAQLKARQSESEITAELEVARAKDAGKARQTSNLQAGDLAETGSRGSSQRSRRESRRVRTSNSESNVTNVTNNFNAPLANASLARTLGL